MGNGGNKIWLPVRKRQEEAREGENVGRTDRKTDNLQIPKSKHNLFR